MSGEALWEQEEAHALKAPCSGYKEEAANARTARGGAWEQLTVAEYGLAGYSAGGNVVHGGLERDGHQDIEYLQAGGPGGTVAGTARSGGKGCGTRVRKCRQGWARKCRQGRGRALAQTKHTAETTSRMRSRSSPLGLQQSGEQVIPVKTNMVGLTGTERQFAGRQRSAAVSPLHGTGATLEGVGSAAWNI